MGVAGVRDQVGADVAQIRGSALDEREQPGERSDVSSTRPVDEVHYGTRTISASPLATATAQGGGAEAPPRRLEFQGQRQDHPRPGHPQRVPECDRTTVDVDDVLGDAQLVGRGQADRRERLVDLEQVEVGGADAVLVAGSLDRLGRLQVQRGVRPGDDTVRANFGQPGQSELFCFGLDITTTAAAPSEICEALPAVMVPSLAKAGRSLPRLSAVVSGRTPSSEAKTTGSPLRCGISTGTISSAKAPFFSAMAASW